MCSTLSSSLLSVDDEVNLNTLRPERHLGFAATVGSGKANVPDTAPFESVTRLPPSLHLMVLCKLIYLHYQRMGIL